MKSGNMDPLRFRIETLGCRLNQAESALLAGRLRERGFIPATGEEPAAILIVNSCSVTAAAARKTRTALRTARRHCPGAFIILTGCDADIAAAQWLREPAVNLIVPNELKTRLAEFIPPLLDSQQPPTLASADSATPTPGAASDLFYEPGVGLYPEKTRANLKIQEGCDFNCAYCVIPQARGRPRSRDWQDVLREARALLQDGFKEIVLTGINLALYRDHDRTLADLIPAILDLAPGFRLRLSSLEPGPEMEAVLALMKRQPRLCRFLHLPLQYGEDTILKRMRRRYSVAEFAAFAEKAVAAVPGLCLGSDIIVGFPGETEAIFEQCRETVAGLPLAYVHVFTFSPRPGTPAAAFPEQVHGKVAQDRYRRLSRLAEAKSAAFIKGQLGTKVTVLSETRNSAGNWEGLSDNYIRVELRDVPPEVGENQFIEAILTAPGTRRRAAAGRCLPAD